MGERNDLLLPLPQQLLLALHHPAQTLHLRLLAPTRRTQLVYFVVEDALGAGEEQFKEVQHPGELLYDVLV